MGYNTDYEGAIEITPPVHHDLVQEIEDFSHTRRCTEEDHNQPPEGQPSLWCDFLVEDDQIVWNDSEKTYCGPEWIEYLIKHFLEPAGHTCNGRMFGQGEDADDCFEIEVTDNKVTVHDLQKTRVTNKLFKSASFIDDIPLRGIIIHGTLGVEINDLITFTSGMAEECINPEATRVLNKLSEILQAIKKENI